MSLLGRRAIGAPSFDEQIEAELDAARQHDGIVARCEAELEALATREAAGEITSAEVETQLVEIAERSRRARLGAEQRRRVAASLEADAVRDRAAAAVAEYERALAEARDVAEAAQARSKKVAGSVATLAREVAALERARQRAKESFEAARALTPEDVEFPIDPGAFGDFDELPWAGDVDQLLQFLASGPARPYAEAVAAGDRAATKREADDRRAIEDAVAWDITMPPAVLQDATFSQVERLPERLRPRARALFEERRAVARAPR